MSPPGPSVHDVHVVGAGGATADRVVLMLAVLAVAAFLLWNAVRVWRGVEVRAIERHERTSGPWPGAWGTRRRYRSYLGAGYLGLPAGVGFGLVAATDLMRMLLGENEDWEPWWVASYIGTSLILLSVVCLIIYQWVGMPDALRPPCQRGWEVVDGRCVLVRPGGTPEARRSRRPIEADPLGEATRQTVWPDPRPDDS